MTEIELSMRGLDDTEAAIARVEATVVALGLLVTMKGTLKAYPGCTHWHCKLGREPGTLEITLWPKAGRVWLTIHPGRRAAWMNGLVPTLRRALER
jgi:hypothetical protein